MARHRAKTPFRTVLEMPSATNNLPAPAAIALSLLLDRGYRSTPAEFVETDAKHAAQVPDLE
jgi:hypothetical protein